MAHLIQTSIVSLLLQLGRDYILVIKGPHGDDVLSLPGLSDAAAEIRARTAASDPSSSFKPRLNPPQTKCIDLANPDEVYAHLYELFEDLQQTHCKSIAKCWIKEIEPSKQLTYPYKNGEVLRPPWWPEDVLHREPDHIKKDERIRLLIALVRLRRGTPTTAVRYKRCELSFVGSLLESKAATLQEVYYVSHNEELFRLGKLSNLKLIVSDNFSRLALGKSQTRTRLKESGPPASSHSMPELLTPPHRKQKDSPGSVKRRRSFIYNLSSTPLTFASAGPWPAEEFEFVNESFGSECQLFEVEQLELALLLGSTSGNLRGLSPESITRIRENYMKTTHGIANPRGPFGSTQTQPLSSVSNFNEEWFQMSEPLLFDAPDPILKHEKNVKQER